MESKEERMVIGGNRLSAEAAVRESAAGRAFVRIEFLGTFKKWIISKLVVDSEGNG